MKGLRFFVIMTLLTGVLYPLTLTAIAQTLFFQKANGSLIYSQRKPIGSELIGQSFKADQYFWPRPSSIGYNPLPSGGSNVSPASQKYKDQLKQGGLPEMVMASGSGLDPHITVKAAEIQVERVIQARRFNNKQKEAVLALIQTHTQSPDLGVLGEKRVNVLALNLDLDRIQ